MKVSPSLVSAAYVTACVAVPALWGAIAAWLFRRRDDKAAKRSMLDYQI